MASFHDFLQGGSATKTATKPSTGSFRNFLQSQTDTGQSTEEQARANVAANPNQHVFNPELPSTREFNTQLDQRAPSTSTVKNFFSSIPGALKTVGKLAAELPVNLAKGTYNTFAKPSNAEIQTENQLGLNKTGPATTIVGKTTTRAFSAITEPYASLLGGAVADKQIAKKVASGELPSEVLGNTTKLTVNDYIDALTSSTNLGLALAPFVSKFATKGVLKLSDISETKLPIELTHKEISDITRGRSDLVDPVKVEAFKAAIKDNLGTQLRESGRFSIPQSEPTSFSNFLKNSATRPVSEISNFLRKYGTDTSTSPQKLLTDGRQPAAAEPAPQINTTETLQNAPGEAITPKPIVAPQELTYKPVEQTPQVTPEIRTSKLAQGVEQKAIEQKLTNGFQGLPEYARVNVADQAKAASSLLHTNREKAINIAMGHELPPEGILPESVFVAVENHAIQTKNVDLLRQLATSSSLPTEATGMGQRIRMLAERDPNSAVTAMQKVMKIKETAATKKYGDLTKVKQKIKNQISTEIKKAAPKAKDWTGFLEELKCK